MLLEALHIEQFRGIEDLDLKDLQTVNLLIGGNDVGKTTVLEAIKLFENPEDMPSVLRASRMRMLNRYPIGQEYYTPFESFLHLFPFSDDALKQLSVSAKFGRKWWTLTIEGELGRTLSYHSRQNDKSAKSHENEVEREISVFQGELRVNDETQEIEMTAADRVKTISTQRPYINIEYIAPGQHLGDISRKVFRYKVWEDETVNALRIIDSDVEGIKLVPSDYGAGSNPVIEHAVYGEVPLYTYGDGLKKIFSIASVLPTVKNGILMVDEIETSLQAKHLITVFDWLLTVCNHYDVQLFITTHSAEAISALSHSAFMHPSKLACYRLEKYRGTVQARRFSEKKLDDLVNGSGFDVR